MKFNRKASKDENIKEVLKIYMIKNNYFCIFDDFFRKLKFCSLGDEKALILIYKMVNIIVKFYNLILLIFCLFEFLLLINIVIHL